MTLPDLPVLACPTADDQGVGSGDDEVSLVETKPGSVCQKNPTNLPFSCEWKYFYVPDLVIGELLARKDPFRCLSAEFWSLRIPLSCDILIRVSTFSRESFGASGRIRISTSSMFCSIDG
jgi:hypothetical protein